MQRIIVIVTCIFVYAIHLYSQNVGSVFSFREKKGLANIGVICTLEKNEILIDYINASSIYGIIGAVYASGYLSWEMEEIINSEEFLSLSTRQVLDQYYYF